MGIKKLSQEFGEMQDMFEYWISNMQERPYDVTMSREDLLQEVFYRFISNKYKTVKAFPRAVLKTYVTLDDERALDYVDIEGLSIKKPIQLVNMFLNDFFMENGQKVECKNFNDFYNTLSNMIVEDYEKVFGNIVYVEFPKDYFQNTAGIFRMSLSQAFKNKGFTRVGLEDSIFVRDLTNADNNNNIEIVEENQNRLLKAYEKFVNIYVVGFMDHVHKDTTKEKYQLICNLIESYIYNIEKRLSKESLSLECYLKNRREVDKFLEKTKAKVLHSLIPEANKSDYFYLVKSSFTNFADGKASEEEKEVLNDFFKKLTQLKKALEVRDEKGAMYPVNYFVVMPIQPINMLSILTRMQKFDGFTEEQKNIIKDAGHLTKIAFNGQRMINTGDKHSASDVLRSCKSKYTIPCKEGKRTIDLTTEAEYKKYTDNVDAYIEKHNLPTTEVCISVVGRDILYGREPIKMPKENSQNAEKLKA